MKRIALIACSSSKRTGTVPARELYTGALFTGALAIVEEQLRRRELDAAFVLSAKYGLLKLDDLVASYDQRMTTDVEAGVEWGKRVDARLCELVPHSDGVEVTLYAGAEYVRFLPASPARRLTLPLKGLGIGEQKAELARAMRKLGAKRAKVAPLPRGKGAQKSTVLPDYGTTVADLVLALDCQYPGAADAEITLPARLWSRLVSRAVQEQASAREVA